MAEITEPGAPGRYRKRPIEVEAIPWTGDNADAVTAFAGPVFTLLDERCPDDPDATAQLLTTEHMSWTLLYVGDWIVREKREYGHHLYPCRPDEFAAKYEPAAPAGADRG